MACPARYPPKAELARLAMALSELVKSRWFAQRLKVRTRNMKRFAIAATMIALFSVAAYSQQSKGPLTARTEAERKRDKEIDQAYQDAMKKEKAGKEQAAKSDPWKIVRHADADGTKN
jgi:hypothetical protein